MKIAYSLICLLALHFTCFAQSDENYSQDFVFYDSCSESVIIPEYELEAFPEMNYTLITVFVKRGDLIGHFVASTPAVRDTIRIPKLLFAFDNKNEFLAKKWSSMFCNTVCDGLQTEYYPNGNLGVQGLFDNGKPLEIKTYRENGILVTQAFYKDGSPDFYKVNYFDENGDLGKYQLYTYTKTQTIIKSYNVDGILIETEKRDREG
ncbi:toxin-antitoxin system YwqK family antitoxin [Formosa algae]|uniref:toxin-antitoxin system YwqK family antitoxin n=1 Tax=Formosa algae TaxID=225843 RepID=UPI000CCEF221|nr:hypothetical protein [Formosa algae]PNW29097.1 hypothetical protein BKP44_05770 [Formosa algae]